MTPTERHRLHHTLIKRPETPTKTKSTVQNLEVLAHIARLKNHYQTLRFIWNFNTCTSSVAYLSLSYPKIGTCWLIIRKGFISLHLLLWVLIKSCKLWLISKLGGDLGGMEVYKLWVRTNKEYVHSLESLANVSFEI